MQHWTAVLAAAAAVLAAGAAGQATAQATGGAAEQSALDPPNATWHVGLTNLWGVGPKDRGRNLDIYPVFEHAQWVNALATARNFNTSIHMVQQADVKLDLAAGTLTGKLKVLITPDSWVPKDGQPFLLLAEIDAKVVREGGQCGLTGTYSARREDGQPLGEGIPAVQAGTLIGAAGPTETGWDNSAWQFGLTQIGQPGGIDLDALDITLGIAGGKVRWGRIGPTAQAKWRAAQTYDFDVSGFGPVTGAGIAKGSFALTARHLHAGGDPDWPVRIDLLARRVQGLSGGQATIAFADRKSPAGGVPSPVAGGTRQAFGRGGVSKGGGEAAPADLWVHELRTRPWWAPVKDFQPPAPGEHPRVLFRKSDLPALRKRAATPEGKAIVARLRQLLGKDGQALPDVFNTTPPDNHMKSKPLPMGAFTNYHAAGFGFLYQLTGETRYADLARQCVQMMFDGKIDTDNRYAWFKPGTELRIGWILSAVAYAYDFCHDAWPADFRRKVALELQNYNKETCTAKEPASIARLAGRTGYPPGSNHYGSLIGGTGAALLAIQGDEGTDAETLALRLAEIESNIPRLLSLGFGDAGWFAEGFGASSNQCRMPLIELTRALRNVAGRDYLLPDDNHEWMVLTWIMHLGGTGYANMPNRGVYQGDNNAWRGGELSMGFGAVTARHLPALLWSYETFCGSREPKKQLELAENDKSWATGDRYPIYAVWSLLDWPIGVQPANPAGALPLTAVDRVHGYFIARNRWQDSDDVIVTHWMEYGPKGYYSSRDTRGDQRAGKIRVWGHGLRTAMTTGMTGQFVTHYDQAADGSFTVSAGHPPTALAVDFSRAAGAEAVLVAVGPKAGSPPAKTPPAKSDAHAAIQDLALTIGETPAHVFTLQTAAPPAAKVEGNAVVIGNQTFTWDGKTLTPAVFRK